MVVSESIQIERSAGEVFQYYADFTKHHEFIDLLEYSEILTDGEFAVGSQILEVGEMLMGGTLRMRSEITHFSPNSRATCISIDGGNQIEQDFTVEEVSEHSCIATFTTTVTPPKSLFGMASKMATSMLKPKVASQMKNDMRKFKEILEGIEAV